MRITQLIASDHVRFFAANFAHRWGLNADLSAYDYTQPCVFLGCYSREDADAIRANTSGRKVVMLTGGGSRPDLLHGIPGLVFVNNDESAELFGIDPKADRLPYTIPMKDYNGFIPEVMGTKCYVYIGNGDREKFSLDMLDRVMDAVGHEHFIIGEGLKLPITELIKKYYKPACVNLQINPEAGFTSAVEMAFMGRPTLGNFSCPWNRPFTDELDLIKQLDHYLKALPGQFAGLCVPIDYFHESDDWLHTEFYPS